MPVDDWGGLGMTPDAMRRLAAKATEALIDRIDGLGDEHAWDGEFREVLESQLGGPPPERGREAEEVLEQILREVLPYAARLDHPRFFGFVPSAPTWPGVVADYLAAGFNINSCTWLVSSGTSQLELVVVDWMRGWIGYPQTAGGLLTSGGSAASVEALVAAREAAGHPQRPTVYMSDQIGAWPMTAPTVCSLSPCVRMRAPPSRAQSTRWWRSRISAKAKPSGCTWMPPTADSRW